MSDIENIYVKSILFEKHKRYFFKVNNNACLEECKIHIGVIGDLALIGSNGCSFCPNHIEDGLENGRHYIVCKKIGKATGNKQNK